MCTVKFVKVINQLISSVFHFDLNKQANFSKTLKRMHEPVGCCNYNCLTLVNCFPFIIYTADIGRVTVYVYKTTMLTYIFHFFDRYFKMYNCLIGLFLTALQVTCDITPESANISQEEKLARKRARKYRSWFQSCCCFKENPKKSHGSIVCLIAVSLSNYCAPF